jgi:hypothetical protein
MPTLFDDITESEGEQAFDTRCMPSLADAEALWRTFLLGHDTIQSRASPPASSGTCSARLSSTSCDGDESDDNYEGAGAEEKAEEWGEEEEEWNEEESCTSTGSGNSARSSSSERAAAQSAAALLGCLRLALALPPPASAPRRGSRARSESDPEPRPNHAGGGPGWVAAVDPAGGRQRRRLSVDGAAAEAAGPART